MVYKSIKRSMTMKGSNQSYNVADFYPEGYNYEYRQQLEKENKDGLIVSTKRSKSAKNHDHEKQLVRFRSNKLFSCVTGGV